MSVEVEALERPLGDDWDRIIERCPGRSPFHRAAALSVLASHSGQRLHPLVGYKGQEPVGVFPVFSVGRPPLAAAFSPPPRLKVSYLGPVLTDASGMSANGVERRRCRFVDAALSWLNEETNPRYVHVRTATAFADPRPFAWAGFEVTPRFTYEVDLTPGPDALLEQFSRDARSNVRDAEAACSVREGDRGDVGRIVEQVRRRYDEQDVDFPITASFVEDLHAALPEGAVCPYVCEVEGSFAGGSIVLDDGERLYGWLGTVVPDVEYDVNDLLHWHVIERGAADGRTAYDLVGANDARLSRFKAKFAPRLAIYHELSAGGPATELAERVYRRITT